MTGIINEDGLMTGIIIINDGYYYYYKWRVLLSMKGIQFKINSKNLISVIYEKSSLNFGEIINYFNQNEIKIEDISTEDGDLEDVFVQLTKH